MTRDAVGRRSAALLRRTVVVVVVISLARAAATARAADPPPTASTGVAVDRFAPAVGPAALLGAEGAATTPSLNVSVATGLSFIADPLRLENRLTGELVSRPVREQLALDLGAELGLWRRLAIAVGAPFILHAEGDRLGRTSDDSRPLASTAAGDLRLRLKVSFAGHEAKARGLHAGLLLQVTAPLGGQSDFAATDGVTVEPRLVVDYRLPYIVLVAALGARFAPERQIYATRLGDELTWSAGVVGEPWESATGLTRLRLLLEAAGAAGSEPGSRPVELRGGVRLGLGRCDLDLAAGGGLTRDVAAPRYRVLLLFRAAFDLRGERPRG
jgi:hypothetical protein